MSYYHHYIYCHDCNTLNEPKRVTMSPEKFKALLIDNFKIQTGMNDPKKKPVKDEDVLEILEGLNTNLNPSDYFHTLGLHCYACGSSEIEVKVLEEER